MGYVLHFGIYAYYFLMIFVLILGAYGFAVEGIKTLVDEFSRPHTRVILGNECKPRTWPHPDHRKGIITNPIPRPPRIFTPQRVSRNGLNNDMKKGQVWIRGRAATPAFVSTPNVALPPTAHLENENYYNGSPQTTSSPRKKTWSIVLYIWLPFSTLCTLGTLRVMKRRTSNHSSDTGVDTGSYCLSYMQRDQHLAKQQADAIRLLKRQLRESEVKVQELKDEFKLVVHWSSFGQVVDEHKELESQYSELVKKRGETLRRIEESVRRERDLEENLRQLTESSVIKSRDFKKHLRETSSDWNNQHEHELLPFKRAIASLEAQNLWLASWRRLGRTEWRNQKLDLSPNFRSAWTNCPRFETNKLGTESSSPGCPSARKERQFVSPVARSGSPIWLVLCLDAKAMFVHNFVIFVLLVCLVTVKYKSVSGQCGLAADMLACSLQHPINYNVRTTKANDYPRDQQRNLKDARKKGVELQYKTAAIELQITEEAEHIKESESSVSLIWRKKLLRIEISELKAKYIVVASFDTAANGQCL
ncbi:hypothetical protein BJ742DRAFT_734697 [Cladochytrium replicatum]|nr:hypothetical protein BJ742DRAFT_734697 [Cladochytrium replicatum]